MSGYKLVRPCANCPFRTDVAPYLREDRCIEIAHSLASGQTFPCHKTTTHSDDYEDEYVEMGGEQFCAGAMILMEKAEQPNQMMRIAERVGLYQHGKLDLDAPVFNSFDEFAKHHADKDEDDDIECCYTCGPNCLAPAGYLMDGMIVPASVDASDMTQCEECGNPLCYECAAPHSGDDAGYLCEDCAEYQE